MQFPCGKTWHITAARSMSPRHFKKYLVPHYRRISDLARKHGVDVIYLGLRRQDRRLAAVMA